MIYIKFFRVIAFIILLIAIKMYINHRRSDYKGKYNPFMIYNNISFVKHDITKILFISLFPMMIYGLNKNEKFFDLNNMLHSKVGKIAVFLLGYFIYHELIQPYIITKLHKL